ncbi:BTB/POZ domain and ankyrin repeat-containing protein NPR2 [Citrus sinensis]|nr:BTB/POZ domain and ankyrin repeat-containing protein NPR2 [Citrus sinensis]
MGLADLNLKDARGHTVLHVAARRKEPAVLVTLLSKGACASETTSDGQTAVAICRRMTRRKDYIEATKQRQETNKDRLCIDVLEREMRRNSMSWNVALSPEVMADDFQMKLNYLENRAYRYCLENGTPEEQRLKRARFMELKEDVQKAFYKDMAEKNRLAEELQACIVVFSQLWLLNLVEKALVEDVIPILVAALHCQLNHLRSFCIQRIAKSNLDNVCLEKELPDEVSSEIKSLRVKSNQESEANIAEVDPMHAKIVRRIHKALDSDDVELLKLLLDVSSVTLDDAYALHYAAAYCSPKVFKEVLNMDLACLNLKDARGRTVLHVAARRNEPEVMVTLLSKGACASETTSDGQTAVAICRRMTRRKDYLEATKQGQGTNKDRLCIDVLEREMRRNSMSENLAMPTEVMDDHFQAELDYLENRVAFVRFFPSEARVAMEIAGADTATGLSALGQKGLSGNLKEIDLNETPSMQAKRRQLRLLTLLKTGFSFQLEFLYSAMLGVIRCIKRERVIISTLISQQNGRTFLYTTKTFVAVETGDRYFPHCSQVVNDFLDASLLEKSTLEEQKLKVDMQEALPKDVAYHRRSGLPSSWSAFYKYMAESNQSAFYKYLAESNRSGMSTSSAAEN